MAVYDTTSAYRETARIDGPITHFFRGTAALARAWNDARTTRAALERLSDHELDDIGLTRGDIDRFTRL